MIMKRKSRCIEDEVGRLDDDEDEFEMKMR